jgi:secondary thiamine-phosphate synthase enzyme
MTVYTSNYPLATKGNADIHNITTQVKQAVEQSKLQNGIVTVFCPSSTSGVTTIELEAGVLSDLRRLFDEIANPERPYQHDAASGDGNGHSHVRAALLKPSLSVPFAGGRLTLGTWQSIVYIDFDNRPRQREIVVQVMGE